MALLSELIAPPSADDIEASILALLESLGLPTTAWVEGSWVATIIAVFADALADAWFAVAQIANGSVLGLATGRWVDLIAESQFAEQRTDPVVTVGTFTFTDAGGGPHVIASAGLVTVAAGELKYRNLGAFTVPLNGTVTATVYAEAVGAAYNIPNNSALTLVTSLPTVTVTNPPVGSTWITTLGADVETDAALTKRLPLKWALLSTGSPPAAYEFLALSQTGVTRVKVDDANPDGYGSLRVYIDNAGAVAALQTALDAFRPVGTKATAAAATTQAVTIPGTVYVTRGYRDTAEAAVSENLAALALSTDIGGIVREAQIYEGVMSPDGVVDFIMGSAWTGTPNIQLGTTAIPQFTLALTYLEV